MAIDFFDIPMDGIQEVDELDEYLSKRSRTLLHGGGITGKFIHSFQQWLLITLVFRVSANL